MVSTLINDMNLMIDSDCFTWEMLVFSDMKHWFVVVESSVGR